MKPPRTSRGVLIDTDSLAWLWISWVRKYGLSVQLVSDVYHRTSNSRTRRQAEIVLDYFGIPINNNGAQS